MMVEKLQEKQKKSRKNVLILKRYPFNVALIYVASAHFHSAQQVSFAAVSPT